MRISCEPTHRVSPSTIATCPETSVDHAALASIRKAVTIAHSRRESRAGMNVPPLIRQTCKMPAINEGLLITHSPEGRVRRHSIADPPIWIASKKETRFLLCLGHAAGKGKRSDELCP